MLNCMIPNKKYSGLSLTQTLKGPRNLWKEILVVWWRQLSSTGFPGWG